MKNKYPVIYLYWKEQLASRTDGFNIISKREAVKIICKFYNIKKVIAWTVLKEMENLGMIKSINRLKWEIKNKNNPILNNVSKLYKEVGLFFFP